MAVTKAVIPAAGLGTRFLPATKAQPKEMLPVVDKPTIQYVIEEAVNAGLTDILIVTGRGKRSIEDHFDRAIELEAFLEEKDKDHQLDEIRNIAEIADIHYIRQREPRGLGHAVLVARQHVGDQPFAVLLGDNIMVDPLLQPMIEAYEEYGRSVVAFQEVPLERISSYGSAAFERITETIVKVTDIVEKPTPEEAPSNLGAIGRYVFRPEIFDALEDTEPGVGGEIQLTDAIRKLAKEQAVYGYLFEGRMYDIGNKLEYVKATIEMAVERDDIGPAVRAFLGEFAIRNKLV
jgi:UTP--glucose-1-phosphate uridylyltransferase